MVHWVGEQTDIIICLARDPNQKLTGTKPDPSAVYISYDYGDTYENKTDSFKINDTTYASVDKFYNHPKYNTHVSDFVFRCFVINIFKSIFMRFVVVCVYGHQK